MANEFPEQESDFSDNVITGDETWAFEFNPIKEGQNGLVKSENNTACIFNVNRAVHEEFVPPGQTVNARKIDEKKCLDTQGEYFEEFPTS